MNNKQMTELIEGATQEPDGSAASRLTKIARGFTPNEELDRIIEIQRQNPTHADSLLTPTLRTGLGFYRVAKQAAEACAELGLGTR